MKFSKSSKSDIEFDTASTPDVEEGKGSNNSNKHAPQKQEPRFCTRCKCLIVSAFVLVGLAVGASLILTDSPNPLDYFIPVDPPGAKEATRWDATKGLYLRVEIATDDVWAPIAEQSILDWNESEAVVLTTVRVAHDPECSPVNGRLKVCNDDYGETPWHGINLAFVDKSTNLTIHSVSKLNDRYNTDAASRAYIACHENGHGLGLPHTDEDHFNRDRGDCMDYTIRPERNGVPGDFNLNLLKELYGTPTQPLVMNDDSNSESSMGATGNTAGGSSPWGNPPPPSTNFPPRDNEKEEEGDEKEKDKDDRRLEDGLWYLPDDMDEAEVFEYEKKVSAECKTEYCVYTYKDKYYVKVNQFLVANT